MTTTVLTTATQPVIVAGIDAHKDTHHVVVLDDKGLRIADQEFAATTPDTMTSSIGSPASVSWTGSVSSQPVPTPRG